MMRNSVFFFCSLSLHFQSILFQLFTCKIHITQSFKDVAVQYLHSYKQKSMQNRLWRWDFCLAVERFLTVSAVNAQTC